jgi:hypothetical protein
MVRRLVRGCRGGVAGQYLTGCVQRRCGLAHPRKHCRFFRRQPNLELGSRAVSIRHPNVMVRCSCRSAGTVIIGVVNSKVDAKTDIRLAARAAAIASVGAAMIHFAVLPTHWRDWLPSGLFFASVAGFQLIWGLLTWVRPTVAALAVGILANIGVTALWAWSRTAGVPFGPHAGEPEGVQASGICALLLQCYVVMGAAWGCRRYRAAEVSGFGSALVLLGASAVIAAAGTVGVASGLQHGHHHVAAEAEREYPAPHSEHVDGHHDDSKLVAPPDPEQTRPPAAPATAGAPPPPTDSSQETNGDHHHDE